MVPSIRARLLTHERVTWGQRVAWGALALALGVVLALGPLVPVGVGLGAVVLAVATFAEPLLGVTVVLAIGPFAAWEAVYLPGVLPRDSGQLFLGVVLLAWLGRAAVRHAVYVPRSFVLAALLGFCGVAWLSLIGSAALEVGLPELVKWLEMPLMLVCVADLAYTPRRRAWVLVSVIGAGVLQALIGFTQFFASDGPPAFVILDRYYRAFGTFQQPNPFAGFVGMALALSVGVLLGQLEGAGSAVRAALVKVRVPDTAGEARAGALRWSSVRAWRPAVGVSMALAVTGGALVASGLLAAALGMSWSRGGWLGFGAAAGVMVMVWPRRLWIGPLVAGVVVVVGVVLWGTGQLPQSLVARLTDFGQYLTFDDARGVLITDANYAVLERFAHWQAALEMWRLHPWLGVGFGQYQPAYAQYQLINWDLPLGHAHNIYLNMGAEVGTVGLGAYLALWGVIFATSLQALRRATGVWRGVVLGLIGVWVHLSVHQLFDNLYVDNMQLHIGVLLGLLVVLAERQPLSRGPSPTVQTAHTRYSGVGPGGRGGE